ncbi:hypothetical protein [Chitinophaga sancti]|uniref:HEAT repeat-containing protein n=1 Tax=Chitinophaga sancti TaxID=1004 RepID=A0A1K1SQP8_9BACT|nr:hypothetical protein [Chitinophaga sancti]WQD61057.1 hypothetical protein U0033_24465 [Chitinophaga sancti]WQG86814.1 hypothetical protein SR876_18000 [Chitinophaga sancti]SFW86633.1 hypothetical protein SAMN05661012_05938 [Chitinophaga sancti]
MSKITDEIRERRAAHSAQTLMMLDIVPLSDTDTKYSLLSAATRYLHDPAIAEKWLSLIATETDTTLKADMIRQLAGTGLRQLNNTTELINIMIASLAQDESRDLILPILGRLSVTDQTARQHLIQFYKQQENAGTSRLILSWLLIPLDASPEDIAFYKEIMHQADETDKLVIVNRLLLQDTLELATIATLLKPEEPIAIKEMVLRCCFDRSLVPVEALSTLLKTDTTPFIRTWCIQLLAVHGIDSTELTNTILHAYTQDPDQDVKQAALRVFEYSLQLTPAIIEHLCTQLAAAQNLQLLYLLAPYTAKNETLVHALLELSTQNIRADLAVAIYNILGKLIAQRPALFERFVQAYEQEQKDECRTAILQAITSFTPNDDSLNSFYSKALQAPSPAIKEAGIKGILLIPLTKANTEVVEAAAPVLLHTQLNRELRRLLARKISTIPQLNPATVQVFSQLADHEQDPVIKEICTRVQETAISQAGSSSINWEQWLHKADVAHNFAGIFPHIWMYYGENPEMANRILWAALTPGNSSSLYQEGVSDIEILRFLSMNKGMDDNLSRYALTQLLTTDLGNESKFNHYLLALKGNPGFPDQKDGLWQLLEKRGRYINLILLDEVLQPTAAEFRQQIEKQSTAAGMLPYISYLDKNCSWEPVPELLQAIMAKPFIPQDNDAMRAMKDACRNACLDADTLLRNIRPATSDDGPGFAD